MGSNLPLLFLPGMFAEFNTIIADLLAFKPFQIYPTFEWLTIPATIVIVGRFHVNYVAADSLPTLELYFLRFHGCW